MTLNQPVTLFVGENGTGKSTLLESVAVAAQSITVGMESVETDAHMEPAKSLAIALKLIWNKRTRTGFFLRAEDFIGYTRHIDWMRKDLQTRLAEVTEEYKDREGLSASLAKLPLLRSLAELKQAHGDGLEHMSHGESFLSLFQSRVRPNGLYLLDEPETPLSPMKQLALLSMIADWTKQGCQFIIATHSPILMAIPGAQIYNFDDPPIHPVAYDDLEHVNLMRDFLNRPEQFLRHLR